MAIPRTTRRGLANIKTGASSKVGADKPHLAYLRLGSLEMERQHRLLERANAVQRIRELDLRLRQLEAEKARLLQTVESGPPPELPRETPPARPSAARPPRPQADGGGEAKAQPRISPGAVATTPVKRERGATAEAGGFRFRY